MKIEKELFNEIDNDLKEDFPDIESITQEKDGKIKITGNDDTLWSIFEVIYNGVNSVEFNAGKKEKHYLLVTI